MNERVRLNPEMTVDEMMRTWPSTIPVVIRNQMLCVGCPVGIFHTLSEACHAHDLDQQRVATELEIAIMNAA